MRQHIEPASSNIRAADSSNNTKNQHVYSYCIMQNLLVVACQECQHTAWYYANCLPIAFQWRIEAQAHTRTQLLTYKLLHFTAGGHIGVLPAVVVLMFCFHSHQKPTVKCILFGVPFFFAFFSFGMVVRMSWLPYIKQYSSHRVLTWYKYWFIIWIPLPQNVWERSHLFELPHFVYICIIIC